MRFIAAIALVSMWLISAQAHASGSYGNSIATPTFRYSYVENTRKIFMDSDQADGYMKEHDHAMKVRFLAFRAKAERAIQAARKRGTPIGPYDLSLPVLRLTSAKQIAKVAKTAYPFNLVLDVSTERATVQFEITATRRWTTAQLRSLTATLAKISSVTTNNESSDERTTREHALVAAAGFEAPVAVTQIDQRFGLYVGTVTEVAKADRARVLATLQARLDKILPSVRTSLTAPDAITRLAVVELEPIKPVIERHPQKLPGAFHPWGPLSSPNVVRTREDIGHVSVILMIAPKGTFAWDKVAPPLTAILRDAGLPGPKHAFVEAEAERLSDEAR